MTPPTRPPRSYSWAVALIALVVLAMLFVGGHLTGWLALLLLLIILALLL